MLLFVWSKISWNQGSLMLWISGSLSVTGRGTNLPVCDMTLLITLQE